MNDYIFTGFRVYECYIFQRNEFDKNECKKSSECPKNLSKGILLYVLIGLCELYAGLRILLEKKNGERRKTTKQKNKTKRNETKRIL